jgi:hypothetical protein
MTIAGFGLVGSALPTADGRGRAALILPFQTPLRDVKL